ncbi:methyl-accepting chemotaxis protein [Glaciimonas soli]|uniref:Methyl-accepting transducer domain-containing protein n=1 Tax=Glaciimonas soli TaxID=2590999 RepID=A0A843YI87_9BURK|nr:methyl-accepting chemotaxis protein [Glaciimonas soli]MQQ99478.1 hypothetical protein [Glaciimonas soli]
MKKLTLKKNLLAILIILWVGLIALSLLSARELYHAKLEERKLKVMDLIDIVGDLTSSYMGDVKKGTMTKEDAQKHALERISDLRFEGEKNFFYVFDSKPIVLANPGLTDLIGTNVSNWTTEDGKRLFMEMIKGDLANGETFVEYIVKYPGKGNVSKLGYSRYIKEWDWHVASGVLLDDLEASFMKELLAQILYLVIVGGVLTILLYLLSRSIVKSLGGEPAYATHIATRIAEGDLSVAVNVKDNDSSSLLFVMRQMQQYLAQTVRQIRDGSEAITVGTKEIAAGNSDLSARTEQQAASLEETAASMEQLTATVKQNADNARQAGQLAQAASDIAVNGGSVVNQVITTMQGISESSRRITDIIGVIDGIAFQTNILALNAAVEAARAGEQGRGFAVVAGEVRILAQRSAQAAKEIKVLIDDSSSRVSNGSDLASRAGNTMSEVVQSVKRVTDIMDEISSASQEQSSGIAQVNQAVIQMDQVTQQNAALVEQAAAAAISLEDQAHRLNGAVSAFQLNEAAQGFVKKNASTAQQSSHESSHTVRHEPAMAMATAKSRAKPASQVDTNHRSDSPASKRAVAKTASSDDWQTF